MKSRNQFVRAIAIAVAISTGTIITTALASSDSIDCGNENCPIAVIGELASIEKGGPVIDCVTDEDCPKSILS